MKLDGLTVTAGSLLSAVMRTLLSGSEVSLTTYVAVRPSSSWIVTLSGVSLSARSLTITPGVSSSLTVTLTGSIVTRSYSFELRPKRGECE